MAQNNSGKWYMLDKAGNVVEGEDNPEAVSVLAAPGSFVPQDVVDKHDLAGRLEGDANPMVDFAGNPVVVVGDRAIAADALPADHPQYRSLKPTDNPRQPHATADTDKPGDKPATTPEKAPGSLQDAPKGDEATDGPSKGDKPADRHSKPKG